MSDSSSSDSESDTNEPIRTVSNKMSTSNKSSWVDCKPKSTSYEDALTLERSNEVWAKIYNQASARDETAQKQVRAAVYTYCALNGTSRVGTYGSEVQLANGTTIKAACIPRAAGSDIRKFLRANMDESYTYFKESRVMEEYPRFCSRAADLGIGPQEAFVTADWLTDCALFTPSEKKAHHASFTYAIERAKRAREGKTLERVEGEHTRATLRAQGQAEASEASIEW